MIDHNTKSKPETRSPTSTRPGTRSSPPATRGAPTTGRADGLLPRALHQDRTARFPDNKHGTYFGRIVAYPRADGDPPADQLTDTVRKIKAGAADPGPNKSSRYEINIFNERKDTQLKSFPCLAHLSVHMHERKLHMQASTATSSSSAAPTATTLGSASSRPTCAAHVGLQVGELLMTLGHVELDSTKGPIRAVLKRLDA